jgi:hypothetical protein
MSRSDEKVRLKVNTLTRPGRHEKEALIMLPEKSPEKSETSHNLSPDSFGRGGGFEIYSSGAFALDYHKVDQI